MRLAFYSLPHAELTKVFSDHGVSASTANLLFSWHYKKNHRAAFEHQDLSKKAAAFIKENLDFTLPELPHWSESQDKTVKFVFRMADGLSVESVLIPFNGKYTLCVSSQVGCAMNCSFCFTGTQGLSRSLRAEEIIGQFLGAKTWLSKNRPGDDRILNVVFMGQGEPLNNFDSVKNACEILLSSFGLSLAPAKITVSTAGYLPGLRRWKGEMPNVNVALSLHSANALKRQKLIPLQKKYPLETLLPILEAIPEGKNRFVTYEYLLIKDFNDQPEDAEDLGNLLMGRKAYINLIPFNAFPDSIYRRPESTTVLRFKNDLEKFKIPVTIRTTKGDEILAACGQLTSKDELVLAGQI